MTTPTAKAPRAGNRVHDALELLGFALLVAFAASFGLRWGLLAAGVLLIVVANMRAASAKPAGARLSERLVRALAAYRASST